ncbi:MAG: UDP-N-acetylglucosamine 2-epimerase (hydrolyzing) [Actinobacteria bacterium]|nr:UDP-N-acetylglucosamine 2-epimerase (hydrolyzing) [Actinomycetota bacterium]
MNTARKICVVTGTRAEYGLLKPVISLLRDDPEIQLQLVATGAHLSPAHGMTVEEIERDGFTADAKIQVDLSDDSRLGVARAMAETTAKMSEALDKLQPDLVLVLGDRYEILATAQAAMILSIPVAHIHGGEVTNGAFDDSIRHAITKMAALHFVATQEYARRVVQLGEQPETVFNVGAIGVDLAISTKTVTREVLASILNLKLTKPILLVTFHPTTRSGVSSEGEISEVLAALENFAYCTIVFTGVNADPGNAEIRKRIADFVAQDPKRRSVHDSLGQVNYFSLMRISDLVVGNSSSGIIEAPALHVPTVNIGSRQDGRLRADSIIDVPTDKARIRTAIETALSPTWRERAAKTSGVYGSGNCAKTIAATLKTANLGAQKTFFDLR